MNLKKNKTIIIAEAGVNHNGNINLAKKLINVAAKAGADYVKFQTFDVDHLILKNTKTANYQKRNFYFFVGGFLSISKYYPDKITSHHVIKKYLFYILGIILLMGMIFILQNNSNSFSFLS